MVLNEGRVDLD